MLKVLDLFSGIGGFSLGLERTGGFETVAFCEIEKFPQKVLAKHWPEVPIYEDVRDVTAEQLRADGIIPNVITGGFPCQDISVAGNQKGIGEGTRSGLWSECARLVGEIRPRYAIFENVTALLSGADGGWMQQVLWDLSEVGYDAEWHCIPASSIGAHHQRDRVWIIAHSESQRIQGHWASGKQEPHPYEEKTLSLCGSKRPAATHWEIESSVGRVADGIRNRSHRIKGLGNAVVPQIPELIGRAILEAENEAM